MLDRSPELPAPLRWASFAIVALALLTAGALWAALPVEEAAAVVTEGAFVEQSTALLYFVAAVVMWLLPRNAFSTRSIAALCIIMLAFGARELDLHRYWTATSVLKVSFYLRDAPALHKLVALIVLAVVLWALLHVVRRGLRGLASGLRSGDARSITIGLFLATLAVSKVLDRSSSILVNDFGVAMEPGIRVLIQTTEELLELALPLLALAGVLQSRWSVAQGTRFRPGSALTEANGPIDVLPVLANGKGRKPR
jgi:hypothetical protein